MTDTTTAGVAPATADRSALEGFLRDLYAVAAYFTAHPELPIPHYVTVSLKAPAPGQLESIAELFGKPLYGEDQDQTDIELPSGEGRTVCVIATRPMRPSCGASLSARCFNGDAGCRVHP